MDKYLNKIICGDSLKILKELPDNSVDLVLTDPPYGINYDNKDLNRQSPENFGKIENDNGEIDYLNLITEFQRISKMVIVFGAINFMQDLPYKGIWICWDKRTKIEADKVFGSPFELAWCNKISGYDKIYRIMHGGVINADRKELKKRVHPTQKPVELMKRIIEDFSKEDDIVLDPFLGSGTTAVACKQLKRNYIGIELSEEYCFIAKKRLEQDVLF